MKVPILHMNKSKKLKTQTPDKFPIVGIGASAGGLDAFKKILSTLPENSGMAYVILQHLSPDYPSNLREILSKHSKIPVIDIIHDIDPLPDHIYIIPENNNVVAIDGLLKLKFRTRGERRNNIIDQFFEALAQVHKTFAIGILLSGNAFDGTTGLKKIKECGGATIAQDPGTAKFKGMPQTAINAEVADYVLSPENIPSQLLQIQKSYDHNYAHTEQEHIPQDEENIFSQIVNLIYLRTGNDFQNYKHSTLRRRIARRMVLAQTDSMKDYYNFLRNNKAEQDLLFNDLLISVTYFFRDEHFFDNLSNTAFPLLLRNCTNNSLRIWVAGCSTGEEAYSLAICLHEYLLQNNQNIKVQIFASDISERCIIKARTGIYNYQDVQLISEQRLRNYFTKIDGNYHIGKIPREMCVFAAHNVINDTPFAKIDMISCRNVLIYFNPILQSKVLKSFHFSLKDRGLLFLGKSETANSAKLLFEPLSKNEKIYSRKAIVRSKSVKSAELENNGNKNNDNKLEYSAESDFKKIAFEMLSSEFSPAGVVIDKSLEIIHFHGDNSPYLNLSPGKADFNILKMVPEPISYELQNAIIKARNEKTRLQKNDLRIKDFPYLLSFHINPIRNEPENLMILFYKKTVPALNIQNSNWDRNFNEQRVQNLEKELSQLREDAKKAAEERQLAFEQLQATNEELYASSEELQALNEELETSAEELQCNIEELICVNDELLDRQLQLIAMRNYSESIIKTIREPLVVIDKDFTIKSANASFYNYFDFQEQEIQGLSFFEIGNGLWDVPQLKDEIFKILEDNDVIENFRIDIVAQGNIKKTIMINARGLQNSEPEGMILIALEDITNLLATNELLSTKNFELLSYNRELELFSATASHDMQEPLRKIEMFCKRFLQDEKNLSQSGKHKVERVLSLTSQMSELVSDLINYYRINFMPKDFKKTDLNMLLKKSLSEFKNEINEKKVKVSASSLPTVRVIPNQIKQLFANLISNSIKYSKQSGDIEIRIQTEAASEEELKTLGANPERKYTKIGFIDNGIGFDPTYKDRIFDPFYRLHNSDLYSGSGLGLTLVKKIIENHSGFMKVSSQTNIGTQIFIYLQV